MAYTIVFKDSSVILPSQEQLEGCPIHHVPLAVHVPMNPEEIVLEGAFAGVPRLRHVSVKLGIRLIGAEAWQNCRQLRIVNFIFCGLSKFWMRGKKGGAMLSEGLAPWSLSCLRVFTGFVFRGICACVAIGPEIGVHRVLARSVDKFGGTALTLHFR